MANAAPQLQEAYDLIEAGDLQSARQLLDDIRSSNENNPDFWWIYSHALDRDTLTTERPDVGRLDLQLISMVDTARASLAADGIPAEEKFLIQEEIQR